MGSESQSPRGRGLKFSLLLLQTVTGTLVPEVEEAGEQFSVGGQDVDSPSDSLSAVEALQCGSKVNFRILQL